MPSSPFVPASNTTGRLNQRWTSAQHLVTLAAIVSALSIGSGSMIPSMLDDLPRFVVPDPVMFVEVMWPSLKMRVNESRTPQGANRFSNSPRMRWTGVECQPNSLYEQSDNASINIF